MIAKVRRAFTCAVYVESVISLFRLGYLLGYLNGFLHLYPVLSVLLSLGRDYT